MSRPERDDDSVRPTVWLAAGAIVLACAVFAISFARWLERDGLADVARALADRATSDGTLEPRPRISEGDADAGAAFAWAPVIETGHPTSDRSDPQRAASLRSFGGDDAGVPPPFHETWARGHLVAVSGETEMQRGDECWVRVLPVMGGGYNCLVRITCDDVVVYPDAVERAGYAPCDVDQGRVLSGHDDNPSGRDGDPTLRLDMRRGRIEVTDAAPSVDDPFSFREQAEGHPVRDFSVSIVLDAPRA